MRLSQKQRIFLAAALVASVLIQLLIPTDVVLPRTYLEGKAVGLRNKSSLTQQLTQQGEFLEIAVGNTVEEFQPDKLGLDLQVPETVAQLPTFSLKERLIPLVSLAKVIMGTEKDVVVTRNHQRIEQFAEELAKKAYKQPIDARAEIKNGRLTLFDDKPGEQYDKMTIKRALTQKEPFLDEPVIIRGQKLPAAISKEELEPLTQQFKRITAQPLKVSYDKTTKTIEPNTITTWLTVIQVESGWQLALNPAAVKETFESWAREYNKPRGTTQISLVDNVEVSRVNGSPGRALDQGVVNQQLDQWLREPKTEPIALATVAIPPEIIVTRTYSHDSAQLQAKLNAWLAGRPGRYQIAIRELGGRGRAASHNVSEQTIMASTYKTFLAFVAYRQAEAGVLNLAAPLVNNKNIEQCIEVMIVVSDNPCGIALGQHIGWGTADHIIAANGFSGVKLNSSNGMLVNAKEQANFLAQLAAGSLLNSDNTNKLLNYMKRQIYRNGIPAGSRGATVADKVGFLENYIHDVGIVYGSKSTYALVIMSQGSNWAHIRDLAQAVYDFMNE